MRACDECDFEFGESCIHPDIKDVKKEWATFEGDIWDETETPKWCPMRKEDK